MHTNRLWARFQQLSSIYSPSFQEKEFSASLQQILTSLGAHCWEDTAGASIGGNCGNLYARFSAAGGNTQPPLLFSAHMDTVEPAQGKQAVLHEDGKITSQGTTILGADDISGIVILLEALTRLTESGQPHRPVELLFPVAEEVYGRGSAMADYNSLQSKQAYILDLSGPIGLAAHAAPTILTFSFTVTGKASHAGFAPLEGRHAIAAAAQAIARLPLGEPKPGVTCNIGLITGGEATNIVPALCTVTGEIRSLSHANALAQWEEIQTIFTQTTTKFGCQTTPAMQVEITAYETPLSSPTVQQFQQACRTLGIQPQLQPTLGGSDNNNFALHGIEGIVMACSMHQVHSTREFTLLPELEQATQLVMQLITQEAPL